MILGLMIVVPVGEMVGKILPPFHCLRVSSAVSSVRDIRKKAILSMLECLQDTKNRISTSNRMHFPATLASDIPQEVLFHTADSVQLVDVHPCTNQLDPYMCALLNDLVAIIGELGWICRWIEFNIPRDQLFVVGREILLSNCAFMSVPMVK